MWFAKVCSGEVLRQWPIDLVRWLHVFEKSCLIFVTMAFRLVKLRWATPNGRKSRFFQGSTRFKKNRNRFSMRTSTVSRPTALLCGIVGTIIFWFLMSRPIVALYRGYFDASLTTLRDMGGDMSSSTAPRNNRAASTRWCASFALG